MYKNYKICVIVPAYNEELLIIEMLSGVHKYVDKIYVNSLTATILNIQYSRKQMQLTPAGVRLIQTRAY